MNLGLVRLINRISAIYVFMFCFVPPMQVGTIYRLLAISFTGIWLISALFIDSCFFNRKVATFTLLGFVCVLSMFLARLNIESAGEAFTNLLQTIIILIVGLISAFCFKNDTKFLSVLFTIILILICVYCITTIQALQENPYASRIANSEWLEERFEGNQNVGLYGFVYMCVLSVAPLLYKIMNHIKTNKIADVLSYVALALIIALVITAGYMIAMLSTIISIALTVVLSQKKVSLQFLTILFAIIALFFYREIIEGIIKVIEVIVGDNPVYVDKMEGLLSIYTQGETDNIAWMERIKNYSASVKNIINYPFVGSYFFAVSGGGGHSAVLDSIGKYGWIIAIGYLTLIWKYPRDINGLKNQKHVLYIVVFITTMVFGVLDPYTQEMAISWFFIMPYIVWQSEKAEILQKGAI